MAATTDAEVPHQRPVIFVRTAGFLRAFLTKLTCRMNRLPGVTAVGYCGVFIFRGVEVAGQAAGKHGQDVRLIHGALGQLTT